MELPGRTAIVTGAGRGIGRAIARRLAAEGARVTVADRDGDAAKAVAEDIGGGATAVACDLLDDDQARALVAGRDGLDVLVNNAGGYSSPVFPDAPREHWTRALDLNLRSVMVLTQEALPALEEGRGGAVVNIASSAGLGLDAHPGPEYAVSKAGIIRLTACLAPLSARGVRVNCIAPHTVATEAVLDTVRRRREADEPLPPDLEGELIDPDDVAGVAVDLVRDEHVAGRVVAMRGGAEPRLVPLTSFMDAEPFPSAPRWPPASRAVHRR